MKELTNQVAIVTGASKGIGAGIAKGLAAAGAAVVVNYASSKEGAESVVADIVRRGGKALAVQADLSNGDDVRRLFAATKEAFGALDVLVNNAGVYKLEPLEEVTEKEFHRHFDTNVLGVLLTTREAMKHFGPKGGSVINIGSLVTTSPHANTVVYAATKGAVDIITRVLAKELGPKNIRVNSINPGVVETEGLHTAGIMNDDVTKHVLAATPFGRFGQPDDIAKIAVFLAGGASAWLTGETIVASGGFRG